MLALSIYESWRDSQPIFAAPRHVDRLTTRQTFSALMVNASFRRTRCGGGTQRSAGGDRAGRRAGRVEAGDGWLARPRRSCELCCPVRRERLGQLDGEAAIAAVGHVQPVRPDHRPAVLHRSILPIAHDLEATEEADTG